MKRVTEARLIQRRIALVVFGVLGGFLFSSEFMNALFNNRLDQLDAGLVERLVFAFKPTVVAIYLVVAVLLYLLIMRYLRPLMRFLTNESDYEQARTAGPTVTGIAGHTAAVGAILSTKGSGAVRDIITAESQSSRAFHPPFRR